jgi:transcriptional regulator with XRE-family HTH domain
MGLKEVFVFNLKKFRNLAGISQMKLAEICDTDVSYIGQIEIGQRFPSIKLIERIALALDVDAYKFFMNEPDGQFNSPGGMDDFLSKIPGKIRLEMIERLNTAISDCVKETLNP